ncbi:hypothetical protein HKCCE2091_12290 [Rhodobacterales bacterium HKCCE2091]|nr:hypothetical protein [Rhodobacterales bacterium HKCCE2091]
MTIRAILTMLCLLAAASCGRRDPEPAPLLSFYEGVYDAQIGGTCATFRFRSRDRKDFLQDTNCDGEAEVSSDEVVIDEDRVAVPGAEMIVTAVGYESFSGLWTSQGGGTAEVRFVRRPEEE